MLAADANSPNIAQLRIYKNNQLAATRTLPGFGNPFSPITINIGVANGGMGFDNVTRIEILNITDPAGLSFDDFMFTIAPPPSPTPTPTPYPSPTPFPPTNLIGEANKIKVSLMWDSSGATSYNVKRRTTTSAWARVASALQATRYEDSSVIPDETYYYAVTANNSNGESVDSNVVSVVLVPSCGDYVKPRPSPEHYPDRGNGWALNAEVSDRDGLVLSDVSLNGRYMAKMMSVPYFTLKTNRMTSTNPPQRAELTPNSASPTMRVRLLSYSRPVGFNMSGGVNFFGIVARYAVDRITPTSKSCLTITQNYEFHDEQLGCEPSGKMPCSRFFPYVSYHFEGREGEVLESINVAQRLHYRENAKAANTIGLFRDCDVPLAQCGLPPGLMFKKEANPVELESFFHVVQQGKDLGAWDNIHQTSKDSVSHPGFDIQGSHGGCPECVHTHWRWGAFFGTQFGSGLPIVGNFASTFSQSNQDVDIGIARYKSGEEHPNTDFTSLINSTEKIRGLLYRLPPQGRGQRTIDVSSPLDVVFWYSSTSHEPTADLFFKHGSFFNPRRHDHMMMTNEANASSSPEAQQDGIRSITFGNVYKEGATTFAHVDLNTIAPLPSGYVALDSRAHRIATEAIVSGPHVISFDVPSVNDQSVFNDLAIFHLEQDPFDPDNSVWVDTTILSPDTPAPDFTNRIVNARVNDIGYFVIGKLVQAQPDPGSSDLSVTVTPSSGSLVVENNLSYAVHVTNSGPQSSSVGLISVLPPEATFVSASSSQGTCKYKNGSVYCKLGTLASGSSADISIVANTFEDKAGIPAQGRSIVNTAVVAGNNDDSSLENNSATNSVLLLPSPNSRPLVNIISPSSGATYAPASTINVAATATDSNGSIAKVDFYDGSTLIGTGTASAGNQYLLTFTPSSGPHSVVAVATDNAGRTNSSNAVGIFVKGNGNVTITSPSANAVFDPGSSITVTANSTGSISKVELFANSISLGECIGGASCGVTWGSVTAGSYLLTAVVTDSSGATTTSDPVNISVTNKPIITILSPVDGMSYPLLSKVAIMASARDNDGFVSKVDFYANGSLIGAGSTSGQDQFTVDWMEVPTGVYSLTGVATDNLGVSTTSAPITIGVNTPTPRPGEFIWFDDALPTGAVTPASQEGWYWVDANPGAFSGTKSHQSRNFGQLESPNSIHQHYFEGATSTLPVNAGDKLFTYVFLDINNMPREIMLQWKDASGWEHRAYWGANNIAWGADGTNSRRYMGPLPRAGTWARLEVPATLVGLEGATLNGMAFTLDGGRATFDLAGKTTADAPTPPTTPPGDFVWIEDGPPAGAVTSVVDDIWNWVPGPAYSGQSAHQSYFRNDDDKKFRSHSFTGVQTPMQVNPGDVLFTYVYLGDPDLNHQPFTPDQIMLQWYDGTSWDHRAFWGENYIGQQFPSLGMQGTESHRYMGGVPTARGWYRLEVPASYVGLDGKSVSGMAFSVYRNGKNPFVTWDRSGKTAQLTTVPLVLSATSGVWRLYSNNYGYSYNTNDQAEPEHLPQKKDVFFIHPNEAAGTVPMHRFRKSGYEYFYHTCRTCPGSEWQYEGIAFYVYPNASTPGTVPLYLYHDNRSKYFLTVNQNEAAGMTFDDIWGYVYSTAGSIPAPPTFLRWDGAKLVWQDNSLNETGYKIEKRTSTSPVEWTTVLTFGPNAWFFKLSYYSGGGGLFRVKAFNTFGDSENSNEALAPGPVAVPLTANTPPSVNIVSPLDGEEVANGFAISANAFDVDGNGTLGKVEFFANGTKLGESPEAPYTFVWNNVPPGTYSLTARVTDAAGATTTSTPISVTVTGASNARINVALASNGGLATASSAYPGCGASGANNGGRKGDSASDYWNDAAPANTFPDWLQIDFNGNKTIDEVDVFTVQNNYANPSEPTEAMTFSLYGLTSFDVQYWNGSTWTTVPGGSVSGNNKVWKKITFSAITTTKIRVLTNAAPDGYSRITELEAWTAAPPPTNVALASNGGIATASSSYAGYGASVANNGERKGAGNAYWNDAAPANTFPDWLQVEFNGSKTIDEVDVFMVQDNHANPSEPTESMTFVNYGLTGFDVQYWNGSAWAMVPGGSVAGNNKVWKKITFAAITTTKIRVLTNASPDGYSRITELEAWTAAPPPTNVALAANGAIATASSAYPGCGASGANNGGRKGDSASDYWNDAAPANTFPDWLQIDFNGNKTIDEVDVFTVQNNYANPSEPTEAMTFSLYGLTGFDVQYWNGSAWAMVPGGSVAGNNKVWKKITFSPITTTKIRVLTNAAPDGYSRITEIEVWGSTAQ